ncbi:3,4-dihydroxy-2-butanone-4-phosphate synthase [Ferrimonas sp. YFM]|uniref:3,4-dihydroxy-2-butanone-4-phosphate synthase n=1 Tax=Ferrimonas sp. YFM TaxID=3028878 RepID=UPI002572DF69|nr:3,4-dihydroxy-2-butanone-4-phosphate synthase [Ferrimonas sp. YFM]BDY05819.1 3,4-dihydroxy-2-butanone 4-phosphate synthase [Ferrimonas sp. YFM]
MNQSLLIGTPHSRVEAAIDALKQGQGIILVDDEDRENEGDVIFAAESITKEQMALLIRHGSGIVCLCLTPERVEQLALPAMVADNNSRNQTAFTVSIEAKVGVSTGVSASDRAVTVRTAVAEGARPEDLARPGHVFPLRAQPGGVLSRRGHTEGSVDLARLAGLAPAAVICELNHDDGEMMRLPALAEFAKARQMPLLTIEDLVAYRVQQERQSA